MNTGNQGISGEIRGNHGKAREIRGRQGYRRLIVWKNACELRKFIYELTKKFPRQEGRRASHMRDSARSIKQNIQEGYARQSLGEYIRFLLISKGSLSELYGDLEDCLEDGLINEGEFAHGDQLIGKTDYLFMRLISSLEKKKDNKYE